MQDMDYDYKTTKILNKINEIKNLILVILLLVNLFFWPFK